MKTIELKAVLQRSEVLVGESLPLTITATNPGAQPAEIPNRMSAGEFEFVFRRDRQEGVFTVVSARSASQRRSSERIIPTTSRRDSLAAGAKADYRVDPAAFLVDPLPPGAYTVAVAFGADASRIESAPVPLKVFAPRATEFATLTQKGSGLLAVGFVNLSAPQKTTAALSFLSSGELPRVGILYRRSEAVAPEMITGVALAPFEELTRQEWVGWLQSGAIVAGIGQGSSLRSMTKTEALGLRSMSLHRVGWTPAPNEALFAALGMDSGGRLTLVLARFNRSGPPVVTRVALDGEQLPSLWKIGGRQGDGGLTLVVVTADKSGTSTRVRSQTITLNSGAISAPVTLAERAAPVLALSLDPFGGSLPVVDALFAPGDGKSGLTLLRFSLEGEGQPMEHEAPMPETTAGATLSNWSLTAVPMADPVVAVKSGDRLMSRRFAPGQSWNVLAGQSAAADQLRLESLNESVLAIWLDASLGMKQAFVR